MKTRTFEELIVWQKAHAFVLEVYKFTTTFPMDERFGLTHQFRKAAVSIPANIAEGYKKKGLKDKARFFNISQGSLEECRYYLILSKDLNYGDPAKLNESINEVSRILNAYERTVSAAAA
ncbi:MAG TPA: four helix bundle protein [Bacteroidia bacterium]|jgi:four helix bundle protein|nr:four helix bundle protein [Bacteroidia bacterium]